jgi:hypothetical protein
VEALPPFVRVTPFTDVVVNAYPAAFDPPSDVLTPPIVTEELAKPALVSVPESVSCTLPADGFVNPNVRPLVAAEFSKLTVAEEERFVPFA